MPITEARTYPAPRPRPIVRFLRTFLPWQIVRFAWVNLKMTAMIVKSHGGKNE